VTRSLSGPPDILGQGRLSEDREGSRHMGDLPRARRRIFRSSSPAISAAQPFVRSTTTQTRTRRVLL